MNPWFETIAVCIVALSGVFVGRMFSRLRGAGWILGYLISVLLIAVLIAVRFSNSLNFLPPFSWLTAGRIRFAVLCVAVTMGLTTPFSRLERKAEKAIVCILMVVVVVWFSVMPFLVPALIKGHLAELTTKVDLNGVCFQSTSYTCGPAAAVTALRELGLSADEGEIAILSHTSPIIGTLPRCLSKALQNRYGKDGLKCYYRRFDSIEQLRQAGITLAVLKDAFLVDHCVAVLEVSDDFVTVADPVLGKISMSHDHFRKVWRYSGIVLQRKPKNS